jgi:hypothetical protein
MGDDSEHSLNRPRYIDADGIPGCKLDFYSADGDYAFDGGDSLAIVCTILTFDDLSPILDEEFIDPLYLRLQLLMFMNNEGVPLRHPDKTKWYGQADRCSRDQLIPLLCYFSTGVYKSMAKRVFKAHLRRGLIFAWNTRANGQMVTPWKLPDLTGPDVWALWLRAFQPWYANLILPILDIQLLISSFLWRHKLSNITRNHMLSCIVARNILPNFISKLAFRINDWDTLIIKWFKHTNAVGEYPTWQLFQNEVKKWHLNR